MNQFFFRVEKESELKIAIQPPPSIGKHNGQLIRRSLVRVQVGKVYIKGYSCAELREYFDHQH
ncbi:hypothetical protein NTG1052_590001 [Candidatus Nitrotoga sp. 1052]|nr:hypothetical protein NTG1052_590001 [Candidatus Nitrotoga sp. 1052]